MKSILNPHLDMTHNCWSRILVEYCQRIIDVHQNKRNSHGQIYDTPLDLCKTTGFCDNWQMFYDNVCDTNEIYSLSRDDENPVHSPTKMLVAPFKTWPHRSGDPEYVIPSPDPRLSGKWAYTHTHRYWDCRTEYGKLRMDLVHHIRDYYLNVINSEASS